MNDDGPITIDSLIELAKSDLRDAKGSIKDSGYNVDDTIHDIADAAVPVYNYDLLQVAMSDLTLAVDECDVPAFDGRNSAVNIIASNVYQAIVDALNDEWRAIEDEEES